MPDEIRYRFSIHIPCEMIFSDPILRIFQNANCILQSPLQPVTHAGLRFLVVMGLVIMVEVDIFASGTREK